MSVCVGRSLDKSLHLSQCGLVDAVLNIRACRAKQVSEACDQPVRLEDGLTYVGHPKSHRNGPLSFKKIQRNIDAGLPVCAAIQWDGGGHHFVVITGYHKDRAAEPTLFIKDPWPNYPSGDPPREEAYSQFVNYMQIGRWTDSYLVKKGKR